MITISKTLPPTEKSEDEPPPVLAPQDTITMSFRPDSIFYDGPTGKYLVDAGTYFRTYGRKSPVLTGIERYFVSLGASPKDAATEARIAISDAEVDNHVEWSGNLAGHRKGIIHSTDGKPMLVLTSPAIPTPTPGRWDVIARIISEAFPDEIQRTVFLGWLSGAFAAVVAGIHHPAPLLALAGPVNAGKSLLAYIVKMILGGRSANPHNAWTGGLPWNDDLAAAELLLLDDCAGSTDPRSRLHLAAAVKEALYAADIQLRKRHTSGLAVRPVWRAMICTNDQAENLLILPPITPDTSDKIILLKVERITTPINTASPEGREELQRIIKSELPAFAHHLVGFEIPLNLRDSRSGICAWRHPELEAALDATRPEARLAELLEIAMTSHLFDGLPAVYTASEVEAKLLHALSPVRDPAKSLLHWPGAAGTFLGRLADNGSGIVEKAPSDAHQKVRRFWLRRP